MVIDPIDGSLNARRMLPSFALSVAVASGDSMADVELAFVHDFGADEEFDADHGAGAMLDGVAAASPAGPATGSRWSASEGTKPERILPLIEGLAGKAFRIRGVGSLAITLCYVAAGRFDGMLSGRAGTLGRRRGRAADRPRGRRPASSSTGSTSPSAHLGLTARYDIVGRPRRGDARHPAGRSSGRPRV